MHSQQNVKFMEIVDMQWKWKSTSDSDCLIQHRDVVVAVFFFIFVVDVVITGAVVLVQAMKAYGGWWRIAPVILNLDTRQTWVASQWATSFLKTNMTNWWSWTLSLRISVKNGSTFTQFVGLNDEVLGIFVSGNTRLENNLTVIICG